MLGRRSGREIRGRRYWLLGVERAVLAEQGYVLLGGNVLLIDDWSTVVFSAFKQSKAASS